MQHQVRKFPRNKRFISQIIVGLSSALLMVEYSLAGDVKLIPSIKATEYYSDNILLAPEGQEQSDFVTDLSPSFNMLVNGKRFNARVNYQLQGLFYSKNSSRNQTYSQLSANSSAELTEEYFFVDANVNHTQQIVDPTQPVGNNNIALTGNRTDVTSYSLAPFFKHSFFNKFDALVRYSYSNINYRRATLIDSEQTSTEVILNSPERMLGTTWKLNYSNRKNNYATGSDTEFRRGSIDLGYRFTSRSSIYASGGKEANTFAVSNNQNIDQSFWALGLKLRPSSKDSILIEFGERYFGKTERFNWQHKARRLILDMSYREDLSNSALALLQSQQTTNINVGNTQNQLAGNIGSITSQTYVSEVASVGINYKFSKMNILLNYSDERRKFQGTSNLNKISNANLTFSLRASPVLTYLFNTRWSRYFESTTSSKTFYTNVSFSIQRQLSPTIQAQLSVIHNVRFSTSVVTDYTDNLLSLSLTKSFR